MNGITKYTKNLALLYSILKGRHVQRPNKYKIYTNILRPIFMYESKMQSLIFKI